jgi:hypothetical protein
MDFAGDDAMVTVATRNRLLHKAFRDPLRRNAFGAIE